MPRSVSRRHFLAASGAAAVAATVSVARSPSSTEKINLAVIGADGRGWENFQGIRGENVVAICDVDEPRAAKARAVFPNAAFFTDYRKLFDSTAKRFDAVVISTPDHSHAYPTAAALRLGKHVYCEKPLTHTVEEVRVIRKLAEEKKLVTQMGTQIHAGDNYRRVVEVVQSGGLGKVTRVKVWCNNAPVPGRKLSGPPAITFDADLWMGPVPGKLFAAEHPADPKHSWPHFNWRYWWEFGNGSLGDFGCHFMDLPYWALGLTLPTNVKAEGKKTYDGDNTTPNVLRVDYEFPAVKDRPAVHLTWYTGVTGPSLDGTETYPGFLNGVLFEGEKGKIVADYNKHKLLPDEFARSFVVPAKTIPKSVGHHQEWLDAIRTGGPTTCNFAYSGRLAEAVLLGNVAYRSGKELGWDPAAGKITNTREADRYLAKEYRKGWELKG
jgi:predicted dehydrogenase